MATDRPVVLLVEPDAVERERYGAWLESAGFDPIECSGPDRTDTCLGVRGQPCALVEVADLLVLDTKGMAGTFQRGGAGWRLARYYLSCGKPVVMFGPDADRGRATWRDQVVVLPAQPSRAALVRALRQLVTAISWTKQ